MGSTLVMDSVIKKAQNQDKVWLCMQVSPAICLLDIRTSHCSPGRLPFSGGLKYRIACDCPAGLNPGLEVSDPSPDSLLSFSVPEFLWK